MAGRRAGRDRPVTFVQTPDVKDPAMQRAFDVHTRAIQDLQSRRLLDLFNETEAGYVPASGTDADAVLHADGIWRTVGSSGSSGVSSVVGVSPVIVSPTTGDVVISVNLSAYPTGSGTLNTIPKWTPDGNTLGDSTISDTGSLVTIASETLINSSGSTGLSIAGTPTYNLMFVGDVATAFNVWHPTDPTSLTLLNSNGAGFHVSIAGSFNVTGNAQLGDASTDRVGIGIAPDAQSALTFAQVVGQKIALWKDSDTTAYGFGIQAGQQQYFVAGAGNAHSFGYGDSDAFTESQRFYANGQVWFGDTANTNASDDQNMVNIGATYTSAITSGDYRATDVVVGYTVSPEATTRQVTGLNVAIDSTRSDAGGGGDGGDIFGVRSILTYVSGGDVQSPDMYAAWFSANGGSGDYALYTDQGNVRFGGFTAATAGLSVTGVLQANGTPGTTGQILQINGSSLPVWGAPSTAGITTGTGTNNTLTKWTGANTIGNSSWTDDGTNSATTTSVGVGVATPAYRLDVRAASAGSVAHFAEAADGDAGMYLVSNEPSQALVAAGMAWNGTNWIAKNTEAGLCGISGSGAFASFTFRYNTGLVVGNSFTPTDRFRVDFDGSTTVSGSLSVTGNATIGDTPGSDTHTLNGVTTVVRAAVVHGFQSGIVPLIIRETGSSSLTNAGAGIQFEGCFNGSVTTHGALIKMMKTNSTGGNFSFDLALGTRFNGDGDPTEHLRIKDTGAIQMGDVGSSSIRSNVDVLTIGNTGTGQTTSTSLINATHTGSFDTTAGAITYYGANIAVSATESAGSNTLTGVALRLSATNSDDPIALWVDDGRALFDGSVTIVNGLTVQSSGITVSGSGLSVAGACSLGDAAGDAHSITGTLNANSTAGTNGQVLKVDGGVPKWMTSDGMTTIVKSANQDVTDSTTLTDDNTLQFAVTANARYYVEGYILYSGNDAAADYKWTCAVSAGNMWGSGWLTETYLTTGGSNAVQLVLSTSPTFGTRNVGVVSDLTDPRLLKFEVVFVVSSSGTFKFQFANAALSGSPDISRTLGGSFIRYKQIS